MSGKFYLMNFESMYDSDLKDEFIRSLYEKYSSIDDGNYGYYSKPEKFAGGHKEWEDYRNSTTPADRSSEWPRWKEFNCVFGQKDFLRISEIFMRGDQSRGLAYLKQIVEEEK